MMLANLIVLAAALLQANFPTPTPDFFVGKWTTTSKTGPTYLVVEAKGAKVFVTVDRQDTPMEGTLYLSAQDRPAAAVAIVVNGRDRMFVIRKRDQDVTVDMFSTFADRPPLLWSERFVKSPK
jgi:hypothetical protein